MNFLANPMEQNKIGQIPQPPRQDYVATVPTEPADRHPGRMEGIISLVCAGVSFVFAPIVFGVTGIILGVKAKQKGAPVLGVVGIIFSSLFMIIGIGLSIWLSLSEEMAVGITEGAAWIIFK